MLLAIDVYYFQDQANVAGVLFNDWSDGQPQQVVVERCTQVAAYESGQFYKRELPCILQLLSVITEPIDYIIVDGYVTLGAEKKAGLGMHLYQALLAQSKTIPIIGVAKTQFAGTPVECEVLRGQSHQPLYVTVADIELEQAKLAIKRMHGNYRLPTLLKEVDRLCRQI